VGGRWLGKEILKWQFCPWDIILPRCNLPIMMNCKFYGIFDWCVCMKINVFSENILMMIMWFAFQLIQELYKNTVQWQAVVTEVFVVFLSPSGMTYTFRHLTMPENVSQSHFPKKYLHDLRFICITKDFVFLPQMIQNLKSACFGTANS
jgi:hypothetical protein